MSEKYNVAIDMVNDNSLSLILRKILPGSSVLEVGAAYGRMTKYLSKTLNCKVTIVERDIKACLHARQFANDCFVGTDLNTELLSDRIVEKYDYIIFADVLEHLYNPLAVLKDAGSLIDDGSIWISVPNISHNSILIELLTKDNFEYKELGLLDNTHIRLFTERSLEKLVSDAGLVIAEKLKTQLHPENTEFKNDYSGLPGEVVEFLKNRDNAITYQFVWRLTK